MKTFLLIFLGLSSLSCVFAVSSQEAMARHKWFASVNPVLSKANKDGGSGPRSYSTQLGRVVGIWMTGQAKADKIAYYALRSLDEPNFFVDLFREELFSNGVDEHTVEEMLEHPTEETRKNLPRLLKKMFVRLGVDVDDFPGISAEIDALNGTKSDFQRDEFNAGLEFPAALLELPATDQAFIKKVKEALSGQGQHGTNGQQNKKTDEITIQDIKNAFKIKLGDYHQEHNNGRRGQIGFGVVLKPLLKLLRKADLSGAGAAKELSTQIKDNSPLVQQLTKEKVEELTGHLSIKLRPSPKHVGLRLNGEAQLVGEDKKGTANNEHHKRIVAAMPINFSNE